MATFFSRFLTHTRGFRRAVSIASVVALAATAVVVLGTIPAAAATPRHLQADPFSPKDRLLNQLLSATGSARTAPHFTSPLACSGAWGQVPSPSAGNAAAFSGMTFPAANDGWASGVFLNGSNVGQTLAEHWDGSAWTIVSTPNLGGGDNVLENIFALSSTNVWAVGYWRVDNNSNRSTLIEHWNGTTWSVLGTPNPTGSNTLFNVAGAAANDVWAIGVTGTSTSTQISANTLVVHWDGTSWSVVTATPTVTTNASELLGIKVVTSTNVWAVGLQENFTGTFGFPSTALIMHYNGTGWSQATQAADNMNGDFLSDVNGTASDLWTVGGQFASSTTDSVLTEHSTDGGVTWTAIAGANPNLSDNLFAVAYISSTNVYAVGASATSNPSTSSETDNTLIEQWNGSSWSQVTSANPSTTQGLSATAAISANNVWAGGSVGSSTLAENFCKTPTVTMVSPNTGPAVGGTGVTITGTAFNGATVVNFGSTPAASFNVVSDTSITTTAPAHPGGTVDVTVTGAGTGTSATSASDQFTYVAPIPAVTNVNPNHGPTAGGTSVTITGTGLLFATSVKFGTVPAASITSNTDTTIVAVSPSEVASTVDITVTTAGGTSATSVADQFSFQAPVPAVTSVNPSSGSAGDYITINGTGLSFATSVHFGANASPSIISNTDTQIVAVAPAGTLGSTVDVTVTTAGGTSPTSAADQFTYTTSCYFNWFDNASAGVVGDNIHLLNTSASPGHFTVSLTGATTLTATIAPGAEAYVHFPAGTIGGPVKVSADVTFVSSQRVQFFSTFNEVWCAKPSQASTKSYIPWFDNASAGMMNDNIHVLNPGPVTASVTVSLGALTPITFALMPGQEKYVHFASGTIGGPVVITADHPVLAAQRLQFYQSFNEEAAQAVGAASTTGAFHWFDKASAGMMNDNIHLVNPQTTVANVTLSLPGQTNITKQVPANDGEIYVSFPAGAIGGPVTIISDQAIIATQRVQFYSTFNEVPMSNSSQASTSSHVMWFDKASAGMVSDNIHLYNPSSTLTAHVTVSVPGATVGPTTVAPGAEVYVSFPSGTIGGPVTIMSDNPILAAQRVEYYQSFNEVEAQ